MIEVERRAFAKALQLTAFGPYRHAIPVLSTVRMTANGALRMEGSDLDTMAEVEIPYSGEPIDSFALMDPTRVRSAINAAGGEKVIIGFDDAKAAIKAGALDAEISTLPGDEHPGCDRIADEAFAADLGAGELGQLARLRPAMSTEETRYYLNGVCASKIGDWTYRFAATDGHRLMVVDIPLPNASGEIPDGTIIPRRFVERVMKDFGKTKDPVRLSFGSMQLRNAPEATLAPGSVGAPRISFKGSVAGLALRLTSKLIDGTYPDYRRVIPSGHPHALRVERAALAQAIMSLSSLASAKVRAVKIVARKGAIRLLLTSPDLGSGSFDVPVAHSLPDDYSIGFNGQYLLDCLNALTGDEVTIELGDSGAPALIRDEADTAFFSVLMPMRV